MNGTLDDTLAPIGAVTPEMRDAEIEKARSLAADLRKRLDDLDRHLTLLKDVPDPPYELKAVLAEARERFGYVPGYEEFPGAGQGRYWYRDWHYMDGATSGQISAQGFSPLDTMRRLLANVKRYEHVAKGSGYSCSYCNERDCDY